MLMSILRKILVVFLAGSLPFFLFALDIDTGVIKTAGSSAPVKKVLADSGIFNSIVSSALDQAKTSSGEQGGGVDLTNQIVKKAAEKTITPQYLQTNTEKVLDSVYAWLDGKTTLPDFSIDVASLKTNFAAEAAKAASAQAASLPVCTSATPTENFNVFSATCLPKGLTAAAIGAQIQNGIASGQGFLSNPTITAESIKSGSSNQSVFADQLKSAPLAYQRIKKTPIILGVLSLLTAAAIIFLSSSRAKGLRRVGIILLAIGAILLIFAWGLNYGVNQKALPKLNMDNKVLQEKIRTIVADITQSIDKTYWIIGGIYAGLGALAIGGSMFVRRRRGLPADDQDGHPKAGPAHHEAPSEDASATESREKKSIKIQ